MADRLLIVDFGSQVTQLIARRLREAGVYCEIHPFQSVDKAKLKSFDPKAIVLFASVFATAVTANTPVWLMVLMIVLVMASGLVWYSIVSLFMSSAPVMRRCKRPRRARRS